MAHGNFKPSLLSIFSWMYIYIYIMIMVVHILDDNIDHGQLYKPPKTLVFLIYFG